MSDIGVRAGVVGAFNLEAPDSVYISEDKEVFNVVRWNAWD